MFEKCIKVYIPIGREGLGFWFRASGSGMRVWDLGFRVEGLGFRV